MKRRPRPILASATLWLREKRPGLDDEFIICVEAAVEYICRFPEAYRVVSRGLRRATLRRFPYAIFYLYEAPVIRIFGVVHTSRHPRVWQSRFH